MAVTVLLFSLAKIKEHVTQEKCDEVFSRCEQCLKDWVVNATVIGGSCFGGSKRGHEELEVITSTKMEVTLSYNYAFYDASVYHFTMSMKPA